MADTHRAARERCGFKNWSRIRSVFGVPESWQPYLAGLHGRATLYGRLAQNWIQLTMTVCAWFDITWKHIEFTPIRSGRKHYSAFNAWEQISLGNGGSATRRTLTPSIITVASPRKDSECCHDQLRKTNEKASTCIPWGCFDRQQNRFLNTNQATSSAPRIVTFYLHWHSTKNSPRSRTSWRTQQSTPASWPLLSRLSAMRRSILLFFLPWRMFMLATIFWSNGLLIALMSVQLP